MPRQHRTHTRRIGASFATLMLATLATLTGWFFVAAVTAVFVVVAAAVHGLFNLIERANHGAGLAWRTRASRGGRPPTSQGLPE